MKINLIIGAGQLDRSHLQGLLRLQQEQDIYVMKFSGGYSPINLI